MNRLLMAALIVTAFATSLPADSPKRNVLFIAVDDLRPELGCYGVSGIHSPNIDKLAATGTLFNRAYCQQAVCNPSRVAVLTGLRPESSGVLNLPTFFRTKVPDVVTLPQHFKANGYYTQRFGKIYHTGHGNGDDALSWSEPDNGLKPSPKQANQQLPKAKPNPKPKANPAKGKKQYDHSNQPPTGAPDVPDSKLEDGKIADAAIASLREHQQEPFFLAVGFIKPHLPFIAPKKYWDLYDADAIAPARFQKLPVGAPDYASNNSAELRAYQDIPKQGPISEADAKHLKHGYYASVSYMDAQVGRVLATLDELKLRENTVIVLWGDHGWQLGEHGTWTKHTAWEIATRAPLLISLPSGKSAQKCDALVEFVDMYPTLVEVCKLPPVAGLEGTSLVPLLKDPSRPWKSAAFSVWPKAIPKQGPGMGRAIRTDRYRLVEWKADKHPVAAYELYDHTRDPDETINLAGQTEHQATVEALAAQLHAGWKAARPK